MRLSLVVDDKNSFLRHLLATRNIHDRDVLDLKDVQGTASLLLFAEQRKRRQVPKVKGRAEIIREVNGLRDPHRSPMLSVMLDIGSLIGPNGEALAQGDELETILSEWVQSVVMNLLREGREKVVNHP